MNKKLPEIYKGNDFSHINNNKKIFYSKEKPYDNKFSYVEININDYILNTPVLIETYDNDIIKTKIISKRTNHILTSNNNIIELKKIKSIKYLFDIN